MSQFHSAAVALGVATSFAAITAAVALDAQKPAEGAPQAEQAVAMVSQGVAAKPVGDPSCPKAVVAPDLDHFPKRDDDYKATVEALARDCANLGAETILKVAVVGEGERDKKGPTWFNAPLEVAIKDAEGKTVETRKVRVKVEIPTGVQTVAFRHLEENVSLPPVDGGYAGWTVVVGFDASAPEMAEADPAPAPRATRAKSKRNYAVRRAARTARRQARPPAPPPTAAQVPQPPVAGKQAEAPESPWKRVADSFSERRDKAAAAAQQQEVARQRAAAQQGRRPAAPQPIQRPTQAQQQTRAAPQPQAAAQSQQTNLRTANR